ncbi:MAG TPA: O-antigen ligase family protein [Pseudorhodoplanes sp.]|nr:O-antigen ligase family protein [Pseudorhodoplanes sp.]
MLFLTILISPFVFIEPSPYEAAAAILGFICIVARVTVDRRLLPFILLLTLWIVGGLIALIPVVYKDKTIQFAAVSVFLAFTAFMYACLFTQDCMRRLALVRGAYIVAGTIVAAIGIVGYFEVFSGAGTMFLEAGRAKGTFKDPNVFGPYLIFPILLLLHRLLNGRIGFLVVPLLIMLLALFLSFSRGAWFHFVLSAGIVVGLTFVTATSLRERFRLIAMVVIAFAICFALAIVLLSFDAVGNMFAERAKLLQSYDEGTNQGRFFLQAVAVDAILEFPLGLGPFEFSARYGTQQHNVYLQAFLVYGWFGGLSYLVLVLLTLALGLRSVFVATPWRPVMIVCVATFAGVAAEGIVIDTDHWRHFFLLLGMIWGLSIATLNFAHEERQQMTMLGRRNGPQRKPGRSRRRRPPTRALAREHRD